MLKRFLCSIKIWVLSLFRKAHIQIKPEAIENPVSITAEQQLNPTPVEKQIPFFTKANNLIDEFDGRPPKVWGEDEIMYEGQKMRAIKAAEPQYVDDMPDNKGHLDHINELRAIYNKGKETVNYEDYAGKQ